MKLTADTITDEQIRELQAQVRGLAHPGSVGCPRCGVRCDEVCLLSVPRAGRRNRKRPHEARFIASRQENERRLLVRKLCELALQDLDIGGRLVARAHCAEILNTRMEKKP